jgi:hypothetical protein
MPSKEVLTFWLDMAAPTWLLSRFVCGYDRKVRTQRQEDWSVCQTARVSTARFVAILAVATVIGGCGATPESPEAAVSVGPTCAADITMTGGYAGRVSGPVMAAPRWIGLAGRGVSIDAFLDLPQNAVPTRFMFSVFDGDGPDGPGTVSVTFAEIEPGLSTFGWTEGTHPGRVSLAPDGSNAAFDLEFPVLGLTPAVHLTGSLECPQLP